MTTRRRLFLLSVQTPPTPVDDKITLATNYQADGNGFDFPVSIELTDFSNNTLFFDIDNLTYTPTITDGKVTNSEVIMQLLNFPNSTIQKNGCNVIFAIPPFKGSTSGNANTMSLWVNSYGSYAQEWGRLYSIPASGRLKVAFCKNPDATDNSYILAINGTAYTVKNGAYPSSEYSGINSYISLLPRQTLYTDGKNHVGSLNYRGWGSNASGVSTVTKSFSTQKYNEISIYKTAMTRDNLIALTTIS